MHVILDSIIALLLVLPLIYDSMSITSIFKKLSKKVWIEVDDDIDNFPFVAILLPLYREELDDILPTVNSIIGQDYPKNRIGVFVILEHDDDITSNHIGLLKDMLERHGIRTFVAINNDPRSSKAYALNKALPLIPKEYEALVIYDAGDMVFDKAHLRKVARLISEGIDVVGNKVYRVGENFLSKLSFIDTLLWCNVALPGLFKTLGYPLFSGEGLAVSRSFLEKIAGFPNKLTEDAYLSIYLAYFKSKACLLNVVIYEGAPQTLRSLIKQRIRWYRGYFECLGDVLFKYSKKLEANDLLKLVLAYMEPLALLSSLISLIIVLMSIYVSVPSILLGLAYASTLAVLTAPLYLILDLKVKDKVALIMPLYWFFQGFIVLIALLPMHIPWFKTTRIKIVQKM